MDKLTKSFSQLSPNHLSNNAHSKTIRKEDSCDISDQELLDTLRKALRAHLVDDNFHQNLVRIKELFYERDYTTLFSTQDLLGTYAAEYIPHRALCYRSLFLSLPLQNSSSQKSLFSYVYCLGAGNGSELVGLVASLPRIINGSNDVFKLHIQDMADYQILPQLKSSLDEDFPNVSPLVQLTSSIENLLETPESMIPQLKKATLVTAFFLLNELFAASKKGFALFLKTLITNLPVGAYLMVADSAGSFSETRVSNNQYMVYKLLDEIPCLNAVHKTDAQWYRPAKTLRYPRKLNSMRCFIRLYEKIRV